MENEGQANLMATQDSDCKIFSGDHDVRFMSTPGQAFFQEVDVFGWV
jgi:hypothetical protein